MQRILTFSHHVAAETLRPARWARLDDPVPRGETVRIDRTLAERQIPAHVASASRSSDETAS